jgi:endonuclease/exonuclease/phosphatase family metal-dependent hydrolase
LNVQVLTRDIPNNVDHVAISAGFLKGINPSLQTWNEAKDRRQLSDHMGVSITLQQTSSKAAFPGWRNQRSLVG